MNDGVHCSMSPRSTRRQALRAAAGTVAGLALPSAVHHAGNSRNSAAALEATAAVTPPLGTAAKARHLPALQDEFPENELELLRDFFPDSLRTTIERILEVLDPITGPFIVRDTPLVTVSMRIEPHLSDANERANQVDDARRDLQLFLRRFLADADSALRPLQGKGGVYDLMRRRQFQQAYEAIVAFQPDEEFPRVPVNFRTAETSESIDFTGTFVHCHTPHHHPDETECNESTGPATLEGYRGPATPVGQLVDAERTIRGDDGWSYLSHVLKGECLHHLEDFRGAIQEYETVLEEIEDGDMMGPTQGRFVALRSARAHLADGDALYRQTREMNESDWDEIATKYETAIAQLDRFHVSADNPLRQEIEKAVQIRREQLAARFNFLGYHGSYVPYTNQTTIAGLRELAHARVLLAINAAEKYQQFRERELNTLLQLVDLDAQAGIANSSIVQALDQQAIAAAKQSNVQTSIDLINDQIEALSWTSGGFWSAVAGVAFTAAAAAAVGFTGGAAGAVVLSEVVAGGGAIGAGAAGIASLVSGNGSRSTELRHQLKMARQELAIAQYEENIASAQVDIGNIQLTAAMTKRAILDTFPLNIDVYHALGSFYEGLLRENLDQAIRWAYLYERAVAFWWLRSEPSRVSFRYDEYLPPATLAGLNPQDRITTVLLGAPEALRDLLTSIQGLEQFPDGEYQLLPENNISLKERFPIEFERLLAGEPMHFEISLYDLDKMRPGASKVRIRKLGLHVVGSVTGTGYRGTLTHHGISFVRDRESTLAADNLMPTDEELDAAFAKIAGGAAQGLPVGGVIPLVLDKDILELSLNNEYVATEAAPDLPVTLFQGYSPAGAWTLDLIGLTPHQIEDVYLRWTVSQLETDDALRNHVNNLIDRYEQGLADGERLDKIISLSLGANPQSGVWHDLEATGETTFALDRSLFVAEYRDLKVKSVVARAIAADGDGLEGIRLEITKPDAGFDAGALTTLADGFTEDLGDEQGKGSTVTVLDAADRFDLLGEWQVRLPEPAQFADLDDMRLFIMYEYTEV